MHIFRYINKVLLTLSVISYGFILSTPSAFAGAEKLAEDIVHNIHEADDIHLKQAKAGLPQFDVTTFPSQLFWLAVAFALLYIIFSTKTLPTISKIIENRKQKIEDDIDDADKLKAEAETVQYEYETVLAEVQQESLRITKESELKAKKSMEAALDKFAKKSDKAFLKAIDNVEASKNKVYGDLHDISAEIVQLSVEKITGIKITKKEALSVIHSLDEKNNSKAKAA